MSNLSQFFSGGASIKSIQRGTITISGGASSGTATITSVNTAKCQLRNLGGNATTTASGNATSWPSLSLTNATTITATTNTTVNSLTVGWELTEWT